MCTFKNIAISSIARLDEKLYGPSGMNHQIEHTKNTLWSSQETHNANPLSLRMLHTRTLEGFVRISDVISIIGFSVSF